MRGGCLAEGSGANPRQGLRTVSHSKDVEVGAITEQSATWPPPQHGPRRKVAWPAVASDQPTTLSGQPWSAADDSVHERGRRHGLVALPQRLEQPGGRGGGGGLVPGRHAPDQVARRDPVTDLDRQ